MIGWIIVAVVTILVIKATIYSSDKGVRMLSCLVVAGVAGYALMKGISVVPSAVVCFSALAMAFFNATDKEEKD